MSLLQTGVMNKVTRKYNKLSIPESNTIQADLPSPRQNNYWTVILEKRYNNTDSKWKKDLKRDDNNLPDQLVTNTETALQQKKS